MATFFNTMFVPPAPPTFPHSPKALSPISTLEQSTSCTNFHASNDGFASPSSPRPPGSPWSLSGLFSSSPLQTLFGTKKHDFDGVQDSPSGRAIPTSRPRASIESLRSSLDRPSHFTPPPKTNPQPPQSPQSPMRKQDVNTFVFRSNARSRGHFKPQKTSKGTSSWQLRQFAEATLGSGSLRKAVKLPEGEDLNEWLAVNVVDFYNQINLLYGSITEFCSPQTCPEMKATDEFEYLWQDSETYKKPTKMPAPEYIEHLMAWCQSNIDNESLFPSRIGVPFPKTFPALVRTMFKRLYRVYAHIYCHHYPVVSHLGLEPHLNTSFKHYVLFINEHSLASGKDYWGPLGELVESMLAND